MYMYMSIHKHIADCGADFCRECIGQRSLWGDSHKKHTYAAYAYVMIELGTGMIAMSPIALTRRLKVSLRCEAMMQLKTWSCFRAIEMLVENAKY